MGSKLPEEKRHYTVDEMMDRLKDVQAVKSGRGRKRRRSKQPKGEPNQMFQRTLVKVTVGLAGLLVIVAVVVFAVSKINEFRYGGAKFSDAVAGRLSEMLGMRVGLGKFEVDGRSISMREAVVTGNDGDFVRDLRLKGFQGVLEMRSYFGSEWYLDKFEVFEVDAVVGRSGAVGGVSRDGAVGGDTGGGFGLASRPAAIIPDVIRLRDFSVFWEAARSDYQLRGVDIVAEMFSGEASIHANGGELSIAGFPQWRLGNVQASWSDGVLDIDQSRFSVDDRDELKITGSVDTKPGGGMDLEGTLTRLVLSRFLPEYWAGKMDGFLEGEFEFKMGFGGEGIPEFSGRFEVRDFVLRGLPVFDSLAIYAGEHGLGFMEVPSVRGKFRRLGDVVTISDFESLQAGLLKIRGEITLTRGELGGQIEVGLPDALFDKLAGGRPALFEVESTGFAWAKMNLSGTLAAPVEDLTPKLMELTRKRSEERVDAARRGAAGGTPILSQPRETPSAGVDVVPNGEASRKEQIEEAFENLINGQ